MAELSGKVVIITGASSGIGAATALALAPHRVHLILGARRMDRLNAIAEQCRAAGSTALALPCDVAQRPQVQALVQAALDGFSRLDVMIANAGFGYLAKIHQMPEPAFDEIVNTNVKGTWYAMQEAAVPMLRQQSGHIIAISSAAARRGLPLYGVYSMTKAAQLSLVEAMRVELHSAGVYVSSVHPISTSTEFFQTASRLSGARSMGLGRAQSAELVARKIVRLIAHPKPELWPHSLSRLALSFATMCPRFTDAAMRKILPRRQPPE